MAPLFQVGQLHCRGVHGRIADDVGALGRSVRTVGVSTDRHGRARPAPCFRVSGRRRFGRGSPVFAWPLRSRRMCPSACPSGLVCVSVWYKIAMSASPALPRSRPSARSLSSEWNEVPPGS